MLLRIVQSRAAIYRTLSSKPALQLFTSSDCHLCKHFKQQIEPILKTEELELQETDIKLPENQNWFEKYKYDIPVLHFEGELLMKHYFDAEKLLDRIEEFKEDN